MSLICCTVAFLNHGNCTKAKKYSLPSKKIQKPCSEMFVISGFKVSFPFNSCRGFAGDVVNDTVDAAYFVYYAIGNVTEDFIRDF